MWVLYFFYSNYTVQTKKKDHITFNLKDCVYQILRQFNGIGSLNTIFSTESHCNPCRGCSDISDGQDGSKNNQQMQLTMRALSSFVRAVLFVFAVFFFFFFAVQLSISQQHSSLYSSSWQAQQTSRPHSIAAHPHSMLLATYHSPLNPDGVKGCGSASEYPQKKIAEGRDKQLFIFTNLHSSECYCSVSLDYYVLLNKRLLISKQGHFCMRESWMIFF